MIYTDGVHIVADSLEELHNFAKKVDIGRHWFKGVRKGHPYYNVPKARRDDWNIDCWISTWEGTKVLFVRPREILRISKLMK